MLAVSTSFLSAALAQSDPHAALPIETHIDRLLGLPVSAYEFADGLTLDNATAMAAAIRKAGEKIVSVEAFVPRPRALRRNPKPARELLSLATLDQDTRKFAVESAVETMEFAAQWEIETVVVRGGAIERPQTSLLEKLHLAAHRLHTRQVGRPERDRLAELVRKRRAQSSNAHLDALCRSLDRLLDRAAQLECRLALLNPAGALALPDPTEWQCIIDEFRGSPLCATLDLGNLHYRDWLGFDERPAIAKTLREGQEDSHIVSYRLNDCTPPETGLLPGAGEIPFAALLAGVPTELPLIVNVTSHEVAEVAEALEQLHAEGIGAPPPEAWEDHLPIIGG